MPPQVIKQTNSRVQSKAPSVEVNGTDILGSGVFVGDLEDLYIKLVLYGKNRCGKTTLACQFPKPLALIAIEPSPTGGAKSVKKIPGIIVFRITNKPLIDPRTGKLEEVYGSKKALTIADSLHNHFAKGKRLFETVVIDTATSYQDVILQELMGLEKIPEMLSWGMVSEDQYRDRSSKTREALRPFLDLPCNVIITAQEKDHNPPKERGSKLTKGLQTESFFAADLGGATVKWLHDACDYIAQMYQDGEIKETTTPVQMGKDVQYIKQIEETGRIVRRLRTLYHPNFAAGFRSETPNVVPEYIEAITPQEMYEEMIKVIQGVRTTKGKYS